MIKILKRGNIEKSVFKTTCSSCKSLLEYEIEDIKRVEDLDIDSFYIECPVCGNFISHTF